MRLGAIPAFGTKFSIQIQASSTPWETLEPLFLGRFPSDIPLASRAQIRHQVRHYADHHTLTVVTDKVSDSTDRNRLDQIIIGRIQSNQWVLDWTQEDEHRGERAKALRSQRNVVRHTQPLQGV